MDSIKLRLLKLQQLASLALFFAPFFLWFLSTIYLLAQVVFAEILHWLEYGKWLGRDAYWLFSMREGTRLSDWEGVNQILSSLMSVHLTIAWLVFSGLLVVVFVSLLAADEKFGTFASLDESINKLESKLRQAQAFESQQDPSARFWLFPGLVPHFRRIWTVIYVVIVGGFVMVLALTAVAVLLGVLK